jgi:hypothetical protein
MKTNPNDPASAGNEYDHGSYNPGLSKREYFAAMAMQGLLAGRSKDLSAQTLAKQSIMAADALIDELNLTDSQA